MGFLTYQLGKEIQNPQARRWLDLVLRHVKCGLLMSAFKMRWSIWYYHDRSHWNQI